jgi:hypothetical protein
MEHQVLPRTKLPSRGASLPSHPVPPPQTVPIVEEKVIMKASWIPAQSGLHFIAGGSVQGFYTRIHVVLNVCALQVGWDVRRSSHCAVRCRKNTAAVFNVPERIFNYITYHRSVWKAQWLALELCRDWSYSSVRIASLFPAETNRLRPFSI